MVVDGVLWFQKPWRGKSSCESGVPSQTPESLLPSKAIVTMEGALATCYRPAEALTMI